MKEGEGSVLDNSMVLFGSALSDGNSHNPHKLPLVLGGRGGGRLATRTAPGLFRRHAGGQPLYVDAGCFRHAGRALRRQYWPLPGVLA